MGELLLLMIFVTERETHTKNVLVYQWLNASDGFPERVMKGNKDQNNGADVESIFLDLETKVKDE